MYFRFTLRSGIILLALSLLISSCTGSGSGSDGGITTSQTGTNGGFTYELWNQNEIGSVNMGLREDGTFDITWSGIYNMLARNGVRPGQNVTSVTYNVDDYTVSGGISYLCVYGWFYNGNYEDLVEYYIVENWVNYNPASNATYYGSVTVDDDTYVLYTSIRTNQPSIHPDGNSTFTQYWSIRQTSDLRTSGTIDVPAHFQAWEDAGLTIGSTRHEVSFCIEGFGMNNSGIGYANVSELSFDTE